MIVYKILTSVKRKKLSVKSWYVKRYRGFTLIELLVVISIISVLATIVIAAMANVREKAYLTSAKGAFYSIRQAVELYIDSNNGNYPPDADRNVPPGLEQYLAGGTWPPAPWPGSTFDWDSWTSADLDYPPYQNIYQISIRFCPAFNSPISDCRFPNAGWVTSGWDGMSAVYYCIEGPCRPHPGAPVNHPGYCVNC